MSDTAASLAAMRRARPQLESAVRIGPGLWDGASQRFVLHDARTGWYFRVGPHEHFLISRMDGLRTVDELENEFIDRFQRRLTPSLWQSIFSLLAQRGLLVGSATDVKLSSLRDARVRERSQSRTWLHARLPIVRADGLLRLLEPVVRATDRLAVWVLLWAAAAALVAYVALHWDVVWAQARTLWTDPVAVVCFIVLMWVALALHEVAHGVTAWSYGARDIEIGVMWRFPFLSPYCKVDDTMLFHERSRRVRVALAGVTVSAAVCLPFWVVYLLVPEGSFATVAAAMMTFGMLTALINLIPLFHMDGYYVLMHAVGAFDLEASSRAALVSLVRRDGSAVERSPRRALDLTYGVVSLALMTALVGILAGAGFFALRPLLGAPGAGLAVITGLLATFVTGLTLTRKSRASRAAAQGSRIPTSMRWGQT